MIPHIREGVIEYLRNPKQPWVESDKVVDKAVLRLPEATRTLIWGSYHSGLWDLDRIISETRTFRAEQPQNEIQINDMLTELILTMTNGEYNIGRFARGINLLDDVEDQCKYQQNQIYLWSREFHYLYHHLESPSKFF